MFLKPFFQDTRWFHDQIRGGVVISGRKSFEDSGSVIPGVCETYVITRSHNRTFEAAHTVHNLQGDHLKPMTCLSV